MIGMNVNVPIYREKRRAAVREARARLTQQQAALEAEINEISFEVEQAYRGVIEEQQSLQIYRERLLPAAEQSIESARSSYLVGKLDFLRLVESQRRLLELQESYYAAMAQYHQRLTELERTVGAPPPLAQ
jgi:outer membrane protein TolC